MFDLLGLSTSCEWVNRPASTWSDDEDYKKFVKFAININVVNYLAERGIKLITDFVDMCQD